MIEGKAVRLPSPVMVAATYLPDAVAQTYPAKVIRIVLPFPPGGPADLPGRQLALKVSEHIESCISCLLMPLLRRSSVC